MDMALHRVDRFTLGVPNVDSVYAYYADFGLTPGEGGWFSTTGEDASVLLRPRTPLKDMYLALNPGTPTAGAVPSANFGAGKRRSS